MEQKVCTEFRKYKVDVDIPFVLYEALLNNPTLGEEMVKERIEKAVYDALHKTYSNPKILPASVRKYLEAKHGVPVMDKKDKIKEQAAEEMQEEPDPAETSPAEDNNSDNNHGGW